MTDVDLLPGLRQGHASDFDAIMRRHTPAVYKYALAVLDDHAKAEDVAQETFLLLWRRRRSAAMGASSALPWLLVTCRHLAFNENRRARRHRTVPLDDVILSVGNESAHELLWLSRELEALSSIDRRLVQICLVEGVPYRDAAETLGMTTAAARKRIQRTRTYLSAKHAEEAP